MDKQAEPIRLALKSRSDLLKHYHNAKLPQLYARFCFVELTAFIPIKDLVCTVHHRGCFELPVVYIGISINKYILIEIGFCQILRENGEVHHIYYRSHNIYFRPNFLLFKIIILIE